MSYTDQLVNAMLKNWLYLFENLADALDGKEIFQFVSCDLMIYSLT